MSKSTVTSPGFKPHFIGVYRHETDPSKLVATFIGDNKGYQAYYERNLSDLRNLTAFTYRPEGMGLVPPEEAKKGLQALEEATVAINRGQKTTTDFPVSGLKSGKYPDALVPAV